MTNPAESLYSRMGGYDAVAAVAANLLSRLRADPQLGRFWQHRGEDGIRREKQLLIDFLCANSGGDMVYTGRDMATSHRGMQISDSDWQTFIAHVEATLASFEVGADEKQDVIGFVESTKADIVEA